jgi:polar amino acid transport system substrate-binding protein
MTFGGTGALRKRWFGTRTRAAACASAAIVLAACGSASTVNTATVAPLDVLPKGAEVVHPTPTEPSLADQCTASLAPQAPMPTPGQMPPGSTMAQIQSRGYLNVGVDQNTFLWGYRDTSGNLSGFDIDMLKAVAQAIFGSPGHIKFTIITNEDRIPAVQKGTVDIVAYTMTVNCDRANGSKACSCGNGVDFSSVYYHAGQSIMVPTNSAITSWKDLGGKRVCAIGGNSTSIHQLAWLPVHPRMQLWAAADETDCLVMLQQGQVDAISTDDAILQGLEAQDPTVHLVGEPFSAEPYGMAISKEHPDFTRFVNGVLAQLKADGTWTKLYNQDIGAYTGIPAPVPPQATYR